MFLDVPSLELAVYMCKAVFQCVEFGYPSSLRVPPCASANSVSPFHRTQSLDFGIVTEGSCNLILDNGVEVPMSKGDVVVQRGTIHGWNNVTDQWARIYFILQASKPLVLQGKQLGDAGYKMVDGQVIQ